MDYARDEARSECYVICGCQDSAKETIADVEKILRGESVKGYGA
jgi:hypothetical protein